MNLRLSDNEALLDLSRRATSFLTAHPPGLSRLPSFLFGKPETPQLWMDYEDVLLASLAAGNDKSSLESLNRITSRFGSTNDRVIGLQGLCDEALTESDEALENVLEGYETVLKDNPVNVPVLKRRIALLRAMDRPAEAVSALVEFLDAFPTDADAWSELSCLYQSQGLYSQAIFCLEESLLISPNAWNVWWTPLFNLYHG
ncbi:predicted protein [Uncinocarpus reesii 1704]|uniref:ER membrane protein complex subunit 2 n=1 Tax=Uncinocarpus reesii (strain UAMH 1704) TaxID=336963 RepID=C4JWQ5_UNCRE|nr:uncharacterized protein UREG_06997 [Uncinocarpus reesii 1704]EEP82132.1 predicted protein [Uncinocarpus reesii 1704]